MKTHDVKYLKIDHKITFLHYSKDRSFKHISNKLEAQEFQTLSPEISKFLNHFFIDSTKDLLLTNKLLANKLIEKMNLVAKDIPVKMLLDILFSRNYNMEFFFFENYLADISKIFIKIFHNIDKEYKISSIKNFIIKLEEERNHNLDNDLKYRYKKKKENFPKEILILSETFQLIKTLKFFLPNKVYNIYNYLFVLLNSRWLFTNALEIELDLESDTYNNVFSEDNAENARKTILSNKKAYFLMILFCYFVSKFENLNTLKLKILDSYQIEIDCILKEMKVLINGFHLLDFFSKFKNLHNLDFNFNCIDSNTFERLIILLKKNQSIQSLNVDFFPTNDSFFSIASLSKICIILGINLNRVNSNLGQMTVCLGENVLDEVDYIIDNLILYFERNMETLFFLLKSKKMTEITLKFDPPAFIGSNEKYINILQKFIINIFYDLEHSSWQSLKLKTPHLFFDANRNPCLIVMIQKMRLEDNTNLRNLNISAKFTKITNLHKLIPYNLNYLKIGEMDECSLNSFYKNLEWKKFKELACLKIVLSQYFFDFDGNIESLYHFFSIKKCRNLQQIYLKSSLKINNEQLNKIYSIIDRDPVGKYILQFSGKNISNEKFIFRQLTSEETDFRCLYYMIYAIYKLRFHKLNDRKIIEKIAYFTKRQKTKEVELKLV